MSFRYLLKYLNFDFYTCSFLALYFFLLFYSIFMCTSAEAIDKTSDDLNLEFEIPDVEKKSYEFRLELKSLETIRGLNKDSSLFLQKYPDGLDDTILYKTDLDLKIEASYQAKIARFYGRLKENLAYNDEESWENNLKTEEGYVSLQPSPSIGIDIGKKVLKWGKGYAWNPTAFFSRPKDLDDPDLTLEGYYVISGDLIKSMQGPIKTVALTPVVFPISRNINDEWGSDREIVLGGKAYFFAYDTDLDFMFLLGNETNDRIGLTFSKNISPNFEIHGETAIVFDYTKHVTDKQGNGIEKKYDARDFLLGIRYLSARDTTYIFEYYRNGHGYTEDEIKDYFSFIQAGYDTYSSSQNMGDILAGRMYGSQYYNKQTVMRDYFYLKISNKEPFDILYFTPSLTCVFNINDKSGSIAPQITYAPITNLEFDLKTIFLYGEDNTEYGEKINDYKILASVTYYF
jgi:hypothetical protein